MNSTYRNHSRRAGAAKALWLTAACLTTSLALSACQGDNILRTDSEAENRVHVSGSAQVMVTPDVAAASIGVQTFDADAVVAVTANNERTAAVLAVLEGLGVHKDDLQTSSFSISPQRAYREERPDSVTGFWVRNTISATVRSLDSIGAVLQDAIAAGANEIHGLQFTVSNPDSLEDVARALAVADARRRAEALAAAADASLGRIVSLSESAVSVPSYFRGASEADAVGVPVEPGQVEVSASVSAVFELK